MTDPDEQWLQRLPRWLERKQVNLDRLLARLVDHAVRKLDADRGTVYLVDRVRGEVVSRVAAGVDLEEIRVAFGEGVAGRVARRGEAVVVRQGDEHDAVARRFDDLTGYTTRSLAAVAVRAPDGAVVGVLQVLNKRNGDFDEGDLAELDRLAGHVWTVLDASSLSVQLRGDSEQPLSFRFNQIIGASDAMALAFDRLSRAARTVATVLLRGESGTGKSIVARAIHFDSARAEGPFVHVDCAALPENLIENELFGHVRGAYTGADRDQPGKVQAADGGTLFLDEIGELPMAVQGRLLRLLQDRSFFRVGATEAESVDVRIVTATNRDLEADVAEGRFREDLYYRLRVVEIELPALRDRGPADLDRLIDHFLFQYARRHERPGLRLSAEARTRLHAHRWPGNVRELEHVIESTVVLAPRARIDASDLQLRGQLAPLAALEGSADFVVRELRTLKEVEHAYIAWALERCGGHKTRAAELLGIGRNTLHRKLDA